METRAIESLLINKMKKIYLWFLVCVSIVLLTGCVGIGGEEISLSHEALATQTQKYNERLIVEKPAADLREEKGRIGRTTFTLFAITTGSVTTTSPVEEQIVEQITEALSLLGYQIKKDTNGLESTTSIVQPLTLKVVLNEIWFKNYNWIFPIVPTWGDIKITLILENSNGKKLFENSYEGGGSSLCLSGHCAFDNATKEAMTELLNKVILDFSSQTVRSVIVSNYKSELSE